MDRSKNEKFNIKSYSDLWLMDSDLSLENFDLSAHFRVRKSAIFSNPLPPLSLLSKISSYFFINNDNNNNTNTVKTVIHNNGSLPFYDNTRNQLEPILTQPLIYESTQSYKYFNYNSWKKGTLYEFFSGNKQKKNNKKIKKKEIKNKLKTKTKKKIKKMNHRVIAAETKFVEIQTPIIQMDFFIWFFDFFIVPLLDYSEILGTDWGIDCMFCEAAKFYRNEEIKHRNKMLNGFGIRNGIENNSNEDNENVNNNNVNENKNVNENENNNNKESDNKEKEEETQNNNTLSNINDNYNNNKIKNDNWQNDENVVCAVITSGTSVHHRNERFLEHELGRHNKAILGGALIEIVSESFPLFYVNGHRDVSNPLKSGTTLKTAYGTEPLQ